MLFTTSLILAALAARPNDAKAYDAASEAVEVYAADFEEADDVDYDSWPDGWTRRRGRSYPDFLKIGIAAETRTPGPPTAAQVAAVSPANHVLQIELNGGGALAESASVVISPLYSFVLEGRVKTVGLTHDAAWLSLSFFAADGQLLETHTSPPLTGTADWQTLRIGPITPTAAGVRRASISVHLQPTDRREDLVGSASFDDLELYRLPRMELRASNETSLYTTLDAAQVICDVAGIAQKHPEVLFELFDHEERKLAEHRTRLQPPPHGPPRPSGRVASAAAGGTAAAAASKRRPAHAVEKLLADDAPTGFVGHTSWKPPLPDYGFYRVRVSLHVEPTLDKAANIMRPAAFTTGTRPSASAVLQRTITLAAIRPLPSPGRGEFGWSLKAPDEPLAIGTMATLLGQVGVNWVKLPVWFSDGDVVRADRIAWFAERLSISGIQMVGVLDQPPQELRDAFREKGRLPVASIFIEPELWQPVVDPVMTRLSLKVRWWQLGDDADASFVGFPLAAEKVAEVKRYLERFGQEVRVGITWRWIYEPPGGNKTPWEFLSYRGDPELTADELAEYLRPVPARPTAVAAAELRDAAAMNAAGGARPLTRSVSRASAASEAIANRKVAQRWLVLAPLPRSEYSLPDRAHDLVTRMLAAKIHGADAVFVPQPIDDEQGLLNADCSPGDLLLPWRTAALLVAGSEYLGQLQLPGGSTNHVFARDGRVVMAVWNAQPTTEKLYLGDDVRQLDLWGRETTPAVVQEKGFPQQQIAVGTLPTFVTGLSEPIARWRIGVTFDTPQLASVFGRPQSIQVRLRNPFAQGVGGEIRLHAPKSLEPDTQPVRFKIAEQEELPQEMQVTLQADANSGPQDVRLDFELTADRNYRFSVYRTLNLGLADVQLEMNTRLREDGALIVEQHLTNLTDKFVSFQSVLFPPDRRRETKQIINLGRGRTTVTFILPRGEELIGQKLWLRCEEIASGRVLNYTVVGER